ncbi:MAG: Serine-protein kinase RsbW [Haliscomenobacter sp.]|jgi:serine/threonine-protein kinase RsbW|nr:Serine-protein kinase RsbW [Haliscomenobacter sp.]
MLKLPSNLNSVAEVRSYVDSIVHKYRISPDLYPNILISLTEAVTNAILHGNCQDETKKVEIRLRKKEDAIAICVSDQGCGFDYRNLPDPTSPENLCKCGGRGVFLMHQLSDRLHFKDNGRTVEMRFKL